MTEETAADTVVVTHMPDPAQAAPGVVTTQTTTLQASSIRPSWLSGHLRNIIALSLTVVVCYLAFTGNHDATTALIAAFSVLMGAIWGERAALKQPGKDS